MDDDSAKDLVNNLKKVFNRKDPLLNLNSSLEIVAFVLATINLFGFQWIDINSNKISVNGNLEGISFICCILLIIYICAQAVFIIHVFPALETINEAFGSVTWLLVTGKLIYDFANQPRILISLNSNFVMYIITITWFAIKQIFKQYRWHKWRVSSLDYDSHFYDIHGDVIYEGDIVKHNNKIYKVVKYHDKEIGGYTFGLSLLNEKINEQKKLISLLSICNNDNYDVEILKKSSWYRLSA